MNVVPSPLPWLELSVLVALAGALCVSRLRNPLSAWRWGLAFTGAALTGSALAFSLAHHVGRNRHVPRAFRRVTTFPNPAVRVEHPGNVGPGSLHRPRLPLRRQDQQLRRC